MTTIPNTSCLDALLSRIDSRFLEKFRPFYGRVPTASSGTYGFYSNDYWVLFTATAINGTDEALRLIVYRAVAPGSKAADRIRTEVFTDLDRAFGVFLSWMAEFTPTANRAFWDEARRRAGFTGSTLGFMLQSRGVVDNTNPNGYRELSDAEATGRVMNAVRQMTEHVEKRDRGFWPTIPVPLRADAYARTGT